jgi:hypothetical protein
MVMRLAFVVRLAPETVPSEDRLEGWVEEVDTGEQLRFHSNAELLDFIKSRFVAVSGNLSGNRYLEAASPVEKEPGADDKIKGPTG